MSRISSRSSSESLTVLLSSLGSFAFSDLYGIGCVFFCFTPQRYGKFLNCANLNNKKTAIKPFLKTCFFLLLIIDIKVNIITSVQYCIFVHIRIW